MDIKPSIPYEEECCREVQFLGNGSWSLPWHKQNYFVCQRRQALQPRPERWERIAGASWHRRHCTVALLLPLCSASRAGLSPWKRLILRKGEG